ncbi:MAG TPA: SdrD B-like domain-containing protein, partial [Saprospiraceae bacterium]|nr:SdrD B-like domain-containing protein [Saprospiraceae bacterium]
VTISSNVTGGVAPFNYQWQLLQSGNWVNVGGNTSTYDTGLLNAGTYSYRVVLTNGVACDAVSNTLVITVASHPAVTVSSVSNPICVGGIVQLTSVVTGGTGTITYQWQFNNPASGWQNGGTNSTYNVSGLPVGTYEYRLIVTQSSGCITVSSSYFQTVNPDATVSAAVNNPSICIGGSSVITSTVNGGSGTITYQWYSSPNGVSSWTLISGATNSTYTVPSGSASSLYYRVVTNDPINGCADPFSNSVQVTVVSDPVVTAAAMDDIYCLGESINLSVTVTGGTGTSIYQWQSYSSSTWSNVGSNSNSFNPGALIPGVYQYRNIVTQNSGCEGMSSDIIFTMINFPSGSLTSTPASCGDNAGTITFNFTNDLYATGIMVSLDGGVTYFASIPDSLGSVTYSNLAPGSYPVWAKWAQDECAVFIGNIDVTELACGTICGRVTDDSNFPISSVQITLYVDVNNNDVYDAGDTFVASTFTDGDTGNYCFEDVHAGEYVVVETQPGNYTSVSDYDHTTSVTDNDGYAGPNDPDNMIPSTVDPGESDDDNDFIEHPLLGNITGYVNDDGGAPINNITIQLYNDTNADGNPDGAAIATAITNSSGYYQFTGVEPRHYVLVEINPPSYSDVSDYDHTTTPPDLDGDDSAQGPDNNIPVGLGPNETDADNDFVDGRPGNICGNVSDDTGLPITNVEIRLYLDINNNDSLDVADVWIATTYTDGDTGDYCFEDVTPGEYVLLEIQPAHYASISDYDHSISVSDPDGAPSADDPDNQIAVTLTPMETDGDNDYIEDPLLGLISGYVNDDAGAPLANVSIKLYHDTNADGNPDGTPIITVTTNVTGYYELNGVEAGYYVLVEINPPFYGDISDYDHTTGAGDTDGDDSAQGADNNIPVRVMPEEADEDNDFVDSRPGSICGNVSDDTGLPISNVEVRLYKDVNNNDSLDVADVLLATVFSGSGTGNYCFTNVTPGEYVIYEVQPAFYTSISDYDHSTTAPDTDGGPRPGDPDDEIQVTLMPNETDSDNNYIEDPFTGTITGLVQDDAGTAMNNVTVSLYQDTNADGNADGAAINTTVTNSSGAYSFSGVEPGYYVVIETTPVPYSSISDYDHTTAPPDLDGNDSAQGPDDNIPVLLLPGETDADNNFMDGRAGTICGNVSDDTGLPISSVELRLYLDVNNNDSLDVADVLVATVFTDGDTGDYCFEDVTPGEYVVFEVQPPFYNSISDYDHTTTAPDTDGGALAGDPDDEIQVTLTPAEADMDNDYIEHPFTGSITGHIQDDTGTNMAGVTVNLYKDTNADGNQDGPVIATTTTNTSGNYTFTGVEPGFYVVVEVQPLYYSSISDYDQSTAPPDTDGNDSAQGPDNNIPVRLTPGEVDADNNFVDGRPGNICGNVSDDTGLYISSVEIRLYIDVNNNDAYDTGDILYATTFTDGDTGDYIFEDVTPGDYIIVEIQPANYNSISDYDHSTGAGDPDGDDSAQGWDNDIPVTLVPAEND